MQDIRLLALTATLCSVPFVVPAGAGDEWWEKHIAAPVAATEKSSAAVAGASVAPIAPPTPNAAAPAQTAPIRARWRTIILPEPSYSPAIASKNAAPQQLATGSIGRPPSMRAANAPLAALKPLSGYAHEMSGLASYYHEAQLTSSGEAFDKAALTAAHKTLPLGTKVKVTNLSNGKSAIVRINDRGPFKAGRVIDLSEAAAEQLSMRGSGLARVLLAVVR